MSKRWTEREDRFLVFYGRIPGGHNFIASHDLGRPHSAGKRRYRWLLANRPEFVRAVEAEADAPCLAEFADAERENRERDMSVSGTA